MDPSSEARRQAQQLVAFRNVKRNVGILVLLVCILSFSFFSGDRPNLATAVNAGLLAMAAATLAALVSIPIFSAFQGLPAFWFLAPSRKKTVQPAVRISLPRLFDSDGAGVLESPLFPAPLNLPPAMLHRCGIVKSPSDPRDISKCFGVLLFTRGGLAFFPEAGDDNVELLKGLGWAALQTARLANSPADAVKDAIKDTLDALGERGDVDSWLKSSMSHPDHFTVPWVYLVEASTHPAQGFLILKAEAPRKAPQYFKLDEADGSGPPGLMIRRYYREFELAVAKVQSEEGARLFPSILQKLQDDKNYNSEQDIQAAQAEARLRVKEWFEGMTAAALNKHLEAFQSRYDRIPELAAAYPALFGPNRNVSALVELTYILTMLH